MEEREMTIELAEEQANKTLLGRLQNLKANYDFGQWQVDAEGIRKTQPTGNGNGAYMQTKVASTIPIVPVARLRNVDTTLVKVQLIYWFYGKWQTITVDRSTLANPNSIVKLADYGIEVDSLMAKTLVEYFTDYLARNASKLPELESKASMGWIEAKEGLRFMPFDDRYTFDADDNYRYLYRAICQAGNRDAWIKNVGLLRNNLLMRLTIDASLASPLIELVQANPFVFHLWGGTGAGKSLALMVAMSVWGNPAFGAMTRTMNMTQNSMLSTAAFLKNLPFAGDELQTIKSRWDGNYDALIMCVTEGIDRGRMSFDKNNETKTWKNCFIFTGEENCVKTSSGGGAKNRVISCECVDKLVYNGNAVARFVTKNYGFAGREYVAYISAHRAMVETMYSACFDALMEKTNTTDKQASAMALLLTADNIAKFMLWTEETPLTLDDIEPYLCSADEVDVTVRAYDYVCSVIASHPNNFDPDTAHEFWGRINNGKVTINKQVLEKILEDRGFDLEACKFKWEQRGWLLRSDGQLFGRTMFQGVRSRSATLVIPKEEENDTTEGDVENELPI